jgi:hypothetical protein
VRVPRIKEVINAAIFSTREWTKAGGRALSPLAGEKRYAAPAFRVTDHLNDKARAQFSPPTQQYQLLACRLETHFSRRTMRVSDQRRACVVVARGRVSYGRSSARVFNC